MNRQEDKLTIASDTGAKFIFEGVPDCQRQRWERQRRKEQEGWERLAVLLHMEPLAQDEEVSLPVCGMRGRYDFVEMLYRVASMAIEKWDEQEQHA